ALVAMGETLVQVLDGATGHVSSEGEPQVAPNTAALMLRRLADLTRDVLGCRRVSIGAVDPATGMVSPGAVVGLSKAEEQVWWASFAPPQTLEERLTPALAAALRAGHPVWLEGVSLPESTRRVLFGAQSGMVLPMRLGNELIGAAMVDYADPGHDYRAPDEMQLEETMARLGAQVLERNRLLVERTEARANELALRQTQAQMDTFLGIASHELRPPLTRLKLSLDSTEYRLLKARQRQAPAAGTCAWAVDLFEEHLVRAQQQLDQLRRLIDDLVDASRVRAGKLQFHLQPCDLVAIVHQAVEAEREVATDLPFMTHMPAEGRVLIVADPGRIEQVVTNYLTNALKYSPSDRPVEVGVQTVGQQARVWVRDEGPGLPEAERERIWERFHR